MSVTPIHNPLHGEGLIGIKPELLQQGDIGWLHRLSLFTGRALTAEALTREQQYRSGRLAILGQSVTHGIVRGLELTLNLASADPGLLVTPGYGISATGEDVALRRPLSTSLSSIAVVDPQSGAVISQFPDYAADPQNQARAGVLILQPIVGQVSGASVDTGSGPIIVSGNLEASCDQDPLEFAFEDWQIADGVRLVLAAWPTAPATLTLPAPSPTWRNRLAYTVFSAEATLEYDQRLPWDLLGVPLALVAFDFNWRPLFADRAAVARAGGLPRRRYVLPMNPGGAGTPFLIQPALAQARIAQLAEQLAASSRLTSAFIDFALLPPCGILPASIMDFIKGACLWFPSSWRVQAAPIHQEEVETALRGGMTASPLDVAANEVVEVLVPLPDTVYDPDILKTAKVDPVFDTEVQSATAALTTVLKHRLQIQQEANALAAALSGSQGQQPIDLNAGLTSIELGLRDGPTVFVPDPNESFGTTTSNNTLLSQDLKNLTDTAGKLPYSFSFLNQKPNSPPVPVAMQLFTSDDLADLKNNGLQHFIDRINAKIAKANDLLDLAFLTMQADIYRIRQNVLGVSGAIRLSVSPVVANIAAGESASATASNLQNYLTSLKSVVVTPSQIIQTSAPTSPQSVTPPAAFATSPALANLAQRLNIQDTGTSAPISSSPGLVFSPGITGPAAQLPRSNGTFTAAPAQAFTQAPFLQAPAVSQATPIDVLAQSPIVGAQLDLRTITIAQRLQQTPSQDAIFYSAGNRFASLQLLAKLEIMIEDIPILVDLAPPDVPAPAIYHLIHDPNASAVLDAVLNPPVRNNTDESDLFSIALKILEQHSQLLRAVEGRIQQYRDFVALCETALSAIQKELQQARTLLKQLENDLGGARQNLAFVQALFNDETQRVINLNEQRTYVLRTYVTFVVYSRGRTLEAEEKVPSRQLVPGNIASPVPTCLRQSVAIPPELREIVSLLREAPVAWLPAVAALLKQLEHPKLLQSVGVSVQTRANTQLLFSMPTSSAGFDTGVYAPAIATIQTSQQQVFRNFQMQRAAFDPAQMFNQSWAAQVRILQNVAAVADLISSEAVHAEVVNATSRLIQQISSVATCLYLRVGQALPVERLAWAEYLRGPGLSVTLRTLAVLPNWNLQQYIPRQQMQLLVDWLFQQIDVSNSQAVAFLSDVVRVAILLASHAPVDNVIAGEVALRTKPVVGGVVHLSLPALGVAAGMHVQLYSGRELAAQAVVHDFDSSGVSATFTTVYRPDTYLEAKDVVHFTAQAPQAVALKAFSG